MNAKAIFEDRRLRIFTNPIFLSCCFFWISYSSLFAQNDIVLQWSAGSYSNEVGIEIIQTETNTVVYCAQAGDLPGSATIPITGLANGTYEVRGFDSYGDGWNGGSVSVLHGSDILLQSNGPSNSCWYLFGFPICDDSPNNCNGSPSSVAADGAAVLGTFELPVPQVVSVTYTLGDIPTNYQNYSSSCNGPLTTLSLELPEGGDYQVIGININYAMTAHGLGWRSDQRSQIYCQNTALDEGGYFSGTSNNSGTQAYSRNEVSIANGIYPGGTELTFEMRAWRIYGQLPACGVSYNYVPNGSWTIEVMYFKLPSWEFSDWSDCSESCGEGTQTRLVQCVDSNGNPLPDSSCSGTKPATEQPCFLQPCCDMVLTGSSTIATLGFSNGSASVQVTGGTPPYSFNWSDPFMQTTASALGLFPGNYTCLVTDFYGCTANISVNVPLLTGIPDTRVADLYCNTGGYQLSDIISCVNVPNAQAYRWEFTEQVSGQVVEYTRTGNQHVRLQWVNSLELGKTYNVRVKAKKDGLWGNYTVVCTISLSGVLPLTELLPQCFPTNTQGNPYQFCDLISVHPVVGATHYRWCFDPDTNPANGNEIFYTRNGGNPHLLMCWVDELIPGQSYNVAVETRIGGEWSGFGTYYSLDMAQPTEIQIRNQYCGGIFTPNNVILAESACLADYYSFEFENIATGTIHTRNTSNYSLLLSQLIPAISPGDYNVRVRVVQNGVVGAFGPACQISIAAPGMTENNIPALRSFQNSAGAALFPNPNKGNEVRLNVDNLPEGLHVVDVVVFDAYGKKVSSDQYSHQGTSFNERIQFKNKLSAGLYLIQILVNKEQIATERLVVE